MPSFRWYSICLFIKKVDGVAVKQLQLDSFISTNSDIEFNQYKILSGLKEFRHEFYKNKIYPSLAELVYLSSQLEEVIHKKNNNLSIPLPKGLKGTKHNDKNIIIEIVERSTEKNEYFYELIEWALPRIKSLIDEAYILYDFVEKNLDIEEVGVTSFNKDEGFFMIPDNSVNMIQVYKYECSVYSPGNKPYRSLKTNFLTAVKSMEYYGSAEFIKLELIRKYKERPNIAAYICNINIDFPFNETIFPIAKRKLLAHISEF